MSRRAAVLLSLLLLAPAARGSSVTATSLATVDVAPRLAGGSRATLSWRPGPTFAALGRAEEWEVFLSLDGGATFPMRVTPHLDADIRSFAFPVPDVDAADARLLLRFGDEERETEVEVPHRIVTFGSHARFDASPTEQAVHPGEAARPGEAGVSSWLEGSRRGDDLRWLVLRNAMGGAPPVVRGARSEPIAGLEPPSRGPVGPPESDPLPIALDSTDRSVPHAAPALRDAVLERSERMNV